MESTQKVLQVIDTATLVANFLFKTGRIPEAFEIWKECFILEKLQRGPVPITDHTSATETDKTYRECAEKFQEALLSLEQGKFYQRQGKYQKAKDHFMNALSITKEIGDKNGEASSYGNLGIVFLCLSEYVKAEEYLQKALQIKKETGDNIGEASCYGNLGSVFQSLRKYVKAEEYHQRALQMIKQLGDKDREATCYGNLGTLFLSFREYAKAEAYLQKALQIRRETGGKDGEATCYANLGTVFLSLAEYVKAEEYLQKALQIKREYGDKRGEASCYENLGSVFLSLGEYVKAEEYLQKALQIQKEIGDKCGEAACYRSLGTLFESLCEYLKAEEYLQKALQIQKETDDKRGEAASYGNLGLVFLYLGKYVKAEEYLQNAIKIKKVIGDSAAVATSYGNLASVFQSLGEYDKAVEYLKKALQIQKGNGDQAGVATSYTNLGSVFQYLGEDVKAEEYLQKALQIQKEIGDKAGVASSYLNLGSVCQSVGKYVKAENFYRKSIVINKEIGDRRGEASSYINRGNLLFHTGEYFKAKEDHEKALVLSYEIGCIELQFYSHLSLTRDTLCLTGNIEEAVSNLLPSIEKCEEMRRFLRDNDQFKISFLDKHASPYKYLSALYLKTRKFNEALCVEELGRARALADLISAQYSVEQRRSVNPPSWFNIERIQTKESNCSCLYLSCHDHQLLLWVIEPNKTIQFRLKDFNDHFENKKEGRSVDKIFGDITFRRFHFPPTQVHCEDRSLFPSNADYMKEASSWGHGPGVVFRPVEKDEEEDQHIDPPNLAQCYKMIIDPVADLLVEPEIIIVPDRTLYKVPFSAFKDGNEKYFSEMFRIRIVPSLTTLRLIQESPEDYHSQTGALIVGEPDVSDVYHKGRLEKLCPLPGAKEEAEMIGRLLGVQPLLGEHATKQAVLQRIHSAGLIHIAAHGDAERGEIALAAPRSFEGIPQEEHYLLTMAEISQVCLRAKLVVLSCCHSANGQIRSEGVVGIARAFLGSGARSVLVALWAIEDLATKQFMSHFYDYLVRGDSASESLHQTMKWMRGNRFSEVRQWAPFMLIGDNVTFEFGK